MRRRTTRTSRSCSTSGAASIPSRARCSRIPWRSEARAKHSSAVRYTIRPCRRRDRVTGGLMDDIELLRELIGSAKNVVAFTGAGISTESGIPDFRSPGSIWRQHPPVSYRAFLHDPEARREYWRTRQSLIYQVSAARPNAAHQALAELERKGILAGVITQNF